MADTAEVSRRMEQWSAANPRPQATLAQVADHIEHVRKVAGVDHVGLGSDFDGITNVPVGLEDVSTFPQLFAELIRRGWSDDDLRKLAGRNVLRVLREAERTSERLRKERQPSTMTIGPVVHVTAAIVRIPVMSAGRPCSPPAPRTPPPSPRRRTTGSHS